MPAKPYLILAVMLAAAAGCGGTGATSSSSPSPVAATKSAPAESVPARTPSPAALPEGYNPKRDPNADITAALAESKADGHPVLLDFGANWCPDCVVLQRLFRSDSVRPVIGGFHVVAVDVGKFDRHLGVVRRYHLNLQTSGIPALVVLSDKGKVRTATNDGSFSNARTMKAAQVAAFLKRWR